MSEWALAAGGAFWLGVLTAVSPCLMAANVTAMTFIARRAGHPKYVLLSAAFYTAGQALAYVALGMLLVSSLLSVPLVSQWLQQHMLRVLGPVLILAAMFLFELLQFQLGSGKLKEGVQKRAAAGGLWVAALLGMVFAMTFCPTTAALFFGSLIPLAIAHESAVLLPLSYALGVALPVIAFGMLIALAAHQVGRVFERVGRLERWARYATGGVFLIAGIYYTLAFTLGLV